MLMATGREQVRSGDQGNAAVGAEEGVGAGSAVDDSHDPLAGTVDQTTGRVEDAPATRLGSGVHPGTVEAQQLAFPRTRPGQFTRVRE